jgi:hypothetical protein
MIDVAEGYKKQVSDFLEQAEETELKIDMVWFRSKVNI